MMVPSQNLRRVAIRSLASACMALCASAPGSLRAANAPDAGGVPSLQLAPGFKATLWAAEPMLENPVAFTFSDQGRCYVVETHRWSQSIFDITRHPEWLLQDLSFRTVGDRSNFLASAFSTNAALLTRDSERVRWMEDRSGGGRADVGGVFATGFQLPTSGTAAGIAARGDDVWFASIPDLWRLGSSSSGAEADRREVLHSGFGVHIGVSGHDLHGLKFGPDGRLYFSIGDRGFHLESSSTGRVARVAGWRFGLDQPDTGAVLRCDPDGSNLEVFAVGLRNPQELTFDDEGNLWTGDNDTAGADESRLLDVVEGGDYGWRCSYQHQAGFGPWVQEDLWRGGLDDALPTSGMVSQGPAGFDHYPGTGLGPAWKGHFLMCDFPGGIWDFTVTNRGASFELASKRKFAWGLWPTDVEFGADGGVYVADWVAGWEKPSKGRIYRLAGGTADPDAARVAGILRDGMKGRPASELGALLRHRDRRVRLRSQWELVSRGAAGLAVLEEAAMTPLLGAARLHGLWGAGQVARGAGAGDDASRQARDRAAALIARLIPDADPAVRGQAARLAGELRLAGSAGALVEALRDPNPRVRLFAAIALGRLGPGLDIAPVLAMIRDNADRDPYLRHGGMMALLGMTDVTGLLALQKSPDVAVRRVAVLALRRLANPEVARFLSDPDPDVRYNAARAINDVPIPGAAPSLAAFLGKVDCDPRMVTRAVNANLRLGEARNATVLANFANRSDVGEEWRVVALDALGDWAKPAPLDRVMGLWRPLGNRPVEPARRALRAVAASLHAARGDHVRIAAMQCAVRLGVREVGHGLFDSLTHSNNSPAVRVEILRTLAALAHSRRGEALALGLADPAPAVRAEALQLAAQQPTDEVLGQLPRFLDDGADLGLQQTALAVAGRIPGPQSASILRAWLDRLAAGKVDPRLVLDLTEAVRGRPEPPLREGLSSYDTAHPLDDSLSGYRVALVGGRGPAGRIVFADKAEVSCQRCHAVGGVGGTVGPSLDGVGKRLRREEILESILKPNARIATGFEQAQITLRDGTAHAGVVRRETDAELWVENLEEGTVKLAKADIAQRTRGLSAMPEGLGRLLTLRELRDLVEYLSGL